LATVNCPETAVELSAAIRELASAQDPRRIEVLRSFLQGAFEEKTAQQRLDGFLRSSRVLRGVCNAYFVALLVLTPTTTYLVGFRPIAWILVIVLGTLAMLTAFLFYRAHRELFPAADDARFAHSAMVLLSPPVAIRACDILARPLVESIHPVTVAKVLGAAGELERLGRKALKEALYPARPVAPKGPELARETEAWHRRETMACVDRFLRHAGVDPEKLNQPPLPLDVHCVAWCPRCEAQFTRRDGACADCGGMPLLPLHAAGG
jgi:hypothetical protein